MDLAMELPRTYYSDYVIQLGGNPTIIGTITLVSMLALASVQFLGGYLADKYGRKWLVSTLTFGVAISYVFFAFAPNWRFILIGATIQNLCLLYRPALTAMFADSLPPEKRGMGFSILNLIMSVTTTPAPIFALMLISTYGSIDGMRIAYIIVTIMFLAAAIVRLKLKESIKNAEKFNFKEAIFSYPKAFKEGIKIWKKVPKSTLFLFISTLISLFSFSMVYELFLVYAFYNLNIGGIPNPSLPPQLDPALQLARVRWGYIMTALFATMVIMSLPVGKLIDKINRKKPLIFASLITIPAIFLIVYGNYSTLYYAMILFGIGQLLGYSASQTLFADLVPKIHRGKVTGSEGFFTNIFMAIGGLTGGILYDNISPKVPFLLTAILAIPSILIIIFYVHEPKERQK
jgi:MFS family permease